MKKQNESYVYKEIINERIVKIIWQKNLFIDTLRTKNGEEFKILFTGVWNAEQGPDFKGAVIEFGGQKIRGDVEIHKKLSDWKKHKHHENNYFANVILNVAFFDDTEDDFVFSSIGLRIRQFEARNYLKKSLKDILYEIEEDNYPYYNIKKIGCCNRYVKENSDRIIHILNLAGEERFFKKVQAFNFEISKIGYENAIYKAFMESLGYKNNKEQFRRLSELVPLDILKNILKNEKSVEERSIILQSIFFDFSGLKDKFVSGETKNNELRNYFEGLFKKKKKWLIYFDKNPIKMDKKSWKYYGVRPLNYPERNIVGLSLFLSKHINQGLDKWLFGKADKLKSIEKNAELRFFIKEFCNDLIQHSYGVWNNVKSSKGVKKVNLIGEKKSLSIILNVFLPILFNYSNENNDISLKEKVIKLYDIFPPLQSNSIIRLMKYRMFGDTFNKTIKVTSEKMQQGLLHIFFNICEENIWDCENCSLFHFAEE